MIEQGGYEAARDSKLAQSIHVGAVVRVTGFNPAAMTVDVQPLSKRMMGGVYQSCPPVLAVPVAAVRGGGFVFRPWYRAGDVGAILYLDHDLDSVLTGGAECVPNTERCHAGEDAVFVGGIVAGNPMQGLPSDSLVMGTEDGSVYLAVTKEGIEIKGKVTVSEDVTAGGISLKTHTHGGAAPTGG